MRETITVLLVDDQKSTRTYLRSMIEDIGHHVVEAANGKDALEIFYRERPDLVVTDLVMPEMDGLTFISELNDRFAAAVPILVVSGEGTLHDAVEAVQRGAWDYLIKPIKPDGTLDLALGRAIERMRLLAENASYRERLEDEVKTKTHALQESKERYRRLLESITSYVYTVRFGESGVLETIHGSGCESVTGFSSGEFHADPDLCRRIVHEEDRPKVLKLAQCMLTAANPLEIEHRIIHKDGSGRWVKKNLVPCRDAYGSLLSYDGIVTDITEHKAAEEKALRHMNNLGALRTIDRAISGSSDLSTTLTVFLQETVRQLRVDAACVLLLNPHSQLLEYVQGLGFESDYVQSSYVHMGEGFAGRIAKERKTRVIWDSAAVDEEPLAQELIEREGFKACIGVPLIAKGQVKGVLEIFNRIALLPDPEWLDFMEALADQAAIALESAELSDRMQDSHSELLLAYDKTIEGWSRALDFRDKETEGHSQRVTELTLRLVKELGLKSEKLAHVRRGALLHDIGKLGVPDSILLKPGKLTKDEFDIMKRHTEIAYSLLSPIEFLRMALDIPYCHHEKWDGSGYPRGLKGEEIPLTARAFAIVDVWDALCSDRPYRVAWPAEKALEHIRKKAGSHFDPNIVSVFETSCVFSRRQTALIDR